MKITYYISGHGYGHAVRAIEVIKSLLGDSHTVHVRSKAPYWLFDELAGSCFHYHQTDLDVGALQKNSFSVDKLKTLQAYAQLMAQKSTIIANETEFLLNSGTQAVLSDITPLAFEAADRLGLPAFAVGNFSWDWIYSEYIETYPAYSHVVANIRDSYATAQTLFRLPFYGDMSAFPHIQDMPLISRISRADRPATRATLHGLTNSTAPIVLLGLRSADLEAVQWENVAKTRSFHFISTTAPHDLSNLTRIAEGRLPFQDLLAGCDAVLTKPGYSMVSEVIGNQVPIMYVPRQDFLEDPLLRNGLQQFAVCEELSLDAFNEGLWQEGLERLLEKPSNWPAIRCDGGQEIARRLIKS